MLLQTRINITILTFGLSIGILTVEEPNMRAIASLSENLPTVTDPISMLLADKRSPATRRAYEGDLKDFFGGVPTAPEVTAFLALPVPAVAVKLAAYKAEM